MDQSPRQARPLPVPSRRVSRLGRLSAMTAGVAGNMAVNGIAQFSQGQRPRMRDLLLTPNNINRVTEELARMRGAAMKIGQLVSMDSGEVLPPELAQIMARLRDDAHFMPPAQVKQVLNEAWGPGWLKSFAAFNVRPIAAASIGQVHRAKLKDGRDAAIKIQYPGVADSIDSDVANVGALIRMSGLLPKGFALAPYLEEARKQLHDETDYALERDQMARFFGLLETDPAFRVPQPFDDWSTQQVLSMSFVPGAPIEEAEGLDQDQRNIIAERLITLTLRELFEFRFMQTDPNFANYRFDRETGEIILLDFGAARALPEKVSRQYADLLRCGLALDKEGLRHIGQDIGFFDDTTDTNHIETILRMMTMSFGALLDHQIYDFSDDRLSKQMQREGIALAESGFVPPPLPLDVLLVQRKLGGMFLLAKRLRAKLPLRQMIEAKLSG